MTDSKTKQQAKRLRLFRKIHRFTGACLFIFFFVVSVSGLLLGWKKHSQGMILPKTQKGASTNPKDWKNIDELQLKAKEIANSTVSPKFSSDKIDRIDVRPSKGIAKFLFKEDYREIQLDLKTGELLQVGRRNSDLIENIHDGSILDSTLGIDGGYIKLTYTTIMGTSLLIFTVTGFWLWFGPKILRRRRDVQIIEEQKISNTIE